MGSRESMMGLMVAIGWDSGVEGLVDFVFLEDFL